MSFQTLTQLLLYRMQYNQGFNKNFNTGVLFMVCNTTMTLMCTYFKLPVKMA